MSSGYWRFRMASTPVPPALCDTPRCSRFAVRGGRFCPECDDQLWELDRMAFMRDRRRLRAPGRLRTVIPWIRRKLWVANLVLVCGVLMYFACVWLEAVIAWLESGGMQ